MERSCTGGLILGSGEMMGRKEGAMENGCLEMRGDGPGLLRWLTVAADLIIMVLKDRTAQVREFFQTMELASGKNKYIK